MKATEDTQAEPVNRHADWCVVWTCSGPVGEPEEDCDCGGAE